MSDSILTICIPTFNRADALDSCLFAICSQINFDLLPVLVIISDNCSTDQTQEIAQNWVKRSNYVKYFRNDVNIGGIKNFWRAAQYVDTKYFWFMGDDALVMPGALRHVVDLLKKNSDLDLLLLAGTNNSKDQNDFIQAGLDENGIFMTADKKNEFISSFWLQTLGCISYLVLRTDAWNKSGYEQQPPFFIYPQIRSVFEICTGKGTVAYSNRYCVHNYRASSSHNDWYISKGAISIVYEFPWLQRYAKELGFNKYYRDGLHTTFLWWKMRQWIMLLSFHPHYKPIYKSAIAQQEGIDRYLMRFLGIFAPVVHAVFGMFVPIARRDLVKKDDLMKSA